MKRVTCLRGIVLLALVTLLAPGCARVSGLTESSQPPSPRPVHLGILVPGAASADGSPTPAEEGARLAADLVTDPHRDVPLPLAQSGGLPGLGGAQVTISVGTSTGDGRQADRQIAHLVEDENADALVGFGDTTELAVASARAEPHQIPFVGAGSSQSLLTQRGLEWFFRLTPTDVDYADGFLNVLSRQPGAPARSRIAVVYPADEEGAATAFDITETATQRGHSAVRVPVPAGQRTNTSVIAAALARRTGGPLGGLVLVAGDEQAARAETSVAATVPGTFLHAAPGEPVSGSAATPVMGVGAGFEAADTVDGLSRRFAGLLVGSAWSSETTEVGRVARSVAGLYAERFGRPMSREAAETFTATYAVLLAADTAGSTDPATLRAGLLALDLPGRQLVVAWDGVRFDETHQNVAARAVIHQLAAGQRVLVEPAELAGPPSAPVPSPSSASDASSGSG